MPARLLMAIVVLCALPVPVSAQPWVEAYRAGNYQKAADLLHVIVTDDAAQLTSGDPAPAQHLASLYARGLGVPRDPIAACALAQMADMAAYMAGPRDEADIPRFENMMRDSERFTGEHCERLTVDDRRMALRSIGCYGFGMPEDVLTLGPFSVRIGRRGIRLADADHIAETELVGCAQGVAGVRAMTLDPPPDAAPEVTPRHFVEVFSWRPTRRGQARTYVLQWDAYEISRDGIAPCAMEELPAFVRDKWPGPGLPPDLDARFSVQMIPSGHVRWQADGDPPRSGWLMLADEGVR